MRFYTEGDSMPVCPKCGGEMRQGEVFVPVDITEGFVKHSGLFSMPGVNMPPVESSRDEKISWRERTGEKAGLFRMNEARVVSIRGMSCIKCGYIELYAQR
jgi:hypothetical protein